MPTTSLAEPTLSLREQYDRDGYLHVPRVFSGDLLEILTREVDRHCADVGASHRGAWQGPWLSQTDQVAMTTVHLLHMLSWTWYAALISPVMRGPVMAVLGVPDVQLHRASILAKPPGNGSPFPMHQDGAYFENLPARYVNAVVYLDDMTPENGPLRFLPGSHRNGLIPHLTEGKKHLPLDQYPIEAGESVLANAGDVVLFSPWTVHGSMPNRSQMVRRTVRVGYGA